MKPSTPTNGTDHPPEHATLRLDLDVERIPGDRVAAIVAEIRRITGEEVSVIGLAFEPVSLQLGGPRLALEQLRTSVVSDGLRRVLGSWRPTAGPVSRSARIPAPRSRQILVVDGDYARARADADVLARAQLETCVVGSIETAQIMMQRSELRFDAVMLRHQLSDGEGLELLDRVAVSRRRCSVLVVDDAPSGDKGRAYHALGAFRYIAPPAGPLQLIGRVNATMSDTQAWWQAEEPGAEAPDQPPRQLVDPEHGADRLQHVCGLSSLEREVALMVLLGLRDLDIADRLSQSERTAKRHVGRVLEKAGIQNRASLWSVLYKDGLAAAQAQPEVEPPAADSVAARPVPSGPAPSRPAPVAPMQPSWTAA